MRPIDDPKATVALRIHLTRIDELKGSIDTANARKVEIAKQIADLETLKDRLEGSKKDVQQAPKPGVVDRILAGELISTDTAAAADRAQHNAVVGMEINTANDKIEPLQSENAALDSAIAGFRDDIQATNKAFFVDLGNFMSDAAKEALLALVKDHLTPLKALSSVARSRTDRSFFAWEMVWDGVKAGWYEENSHRAVWPLYNLDDPEGQVDSLVAILQDQNGKKKAPVAA